YGTTAFGGASVLDQCGAGCGTVFKITSSGNLTTLYSFSFSDGANPYAGLVQGSDGNFYGTTESGGVSNFGTVFKITSGGSLTTLHSFNYVAGSPASGLVQGSDSNVYGTTDNDIAGAASNGTVFKITSGGSFTTLYNFSFS